VNLVPSLQGESGGILAGSVIRRAWRNARKAVLPPHVVGSPTGRRVYTNRNTRLTKWLNDRIPPNQVAEWPGTASPCSWRPTPAASRVSCPTRRGGSKLPEISPSGRLPAAPPGPQKSDTYSTRPPATARRQPDSPGARP
jgi:hypothetical protein